MGAGFLHAQHHRVRAHHRRGLEAGLGERTRTGRQDHLRPRRGRAGHPHRRRGPPERCHPTGSRGDLPHHGSTGQGMPQPRPELHLHDGRWRPCDPPGQRHRHPLGPRRRRGHHDHGHGRHIHLRHRRAPGHRQGPTHQPGHRLHLGRHLHPPRLGQAVRARRLPAHLRHHPGHPTRGRDDPGRPRRVRGRGHPDPVRLRDPTVRDRVAGPDLRRRHRPGQAVEPTRCPGHRVRGVRGRLHRDRVQGHRRLGRGGLVPRRPAVRRRPGLHRQHGELRRRGVAGHRHRLRHRREHRPRARQRRHDQGQRCRSRRLRARPWSGQHLVNPDVLQRRHQGHHRPGGHHRRDAGHRHLRPGPQRGPGQ